MLMQVHDDVRVRALPLERCERVATPNIGQCEEQSLSRVFLLAGCKHAQNSVAALPQTLEARSDVERKVLETMLLYFWVIVILYSRFPREMFSHTASFLGANSICVHHTSMFCFCSPPPFKFLLAFHSCVFLFSLISAPLCAV